MTEGPTATATFNIRKALPWTEIFRSFLVALDPRKLLVAALGILVMSLGWYVLSILFSYDRPAIDNPKYETTVLQRELGTTKPDGTEYTEVEYVVKRDEIFARDTQRWALLHDLAGENGRLRTMPWYEYRGPNPFLLVQGFVGGSSVELQDVTGQFLTGTVPVMVEPLRKLLLPLIMLFDPNASGYTVLYLMLALLWSVATWAFFGGIITRMAAVGFSAREQSSIMGSVRFVSSRYVSYLLSPLVPVGMIAVIVILMAIYGLIALIPGLGDLVLYGLGMPLVLFGGLAIAILLVGLVGYPLMNATISSEGSDAFDAISRSYNYVFQAGWNLLWYGIVAVAYGAIVTLLVVFLFSLIVYMGKWAISQAPFNESLNRQPDYLFIYTPESFGWKQLLLDGGPLETRSHEVQNVVSKRTYTAYEYVNPTTATAYKDSLWWVEKAGAGMVSFWLTLMFLMMIGFTYSYFWCASTMIYLLLRKKVDEIDTDDVYIEELIDEPTPTPTPSPTPATPSNTTSLPTVPSTPPQSPPMTEALAVPTPAVKEEPTPLPPPPVEPPKPTVTESTDSTNSVKLNSDDVVDESGGESTSKDDDEKW